MTGASAGIDVGGTFTDLVAWDAATGTVRLAKVPTTPQNQALGVLDALAEGGVSLPALDLIVHGTTATTNALLERRLAPTGMITTRGFRDVLELGRRTRPHAYGMTGSFRPLIPRDLRLEVAERMLACGTVHTPLDEAAVARAAGDLRAQGCVSVVVHFLHAYANPAHERRAGEIIRALWPGVNLTLGHELLSESREYERGVTAAVNAAVQPLLRAYVEDLADRLAAQGYRHELLVMTGNGGMVSARRVAAEAARTVMSGPASGVMAAAYTGRRAGLPDLLTYDMGGTSSDVALIRGAEPAVSHEIELEYALPIHVPMVDVRTIGAGGGSIARIDAGGLLQVGPESAGADPGPICYGRGGTQPTITDANLLLGRMEASGLSGVTPAARSAVEAAFARLGAELGRDALGAAAAVLRVATARMADAVRMVSVSLGEDPRDFALFAFGGAGPLHAGAIARELGVPRVLVPARPGITNALGCLVADLRADFVQTVNRPVDALDMGQVHAILAQQAAEGRARLGAEQVEITDLHLSHVAEMQFIGQTHLLRVALPDATPSRADLHRLFAAAYLRRFHVDLPEIRPALVNLETTAIGRRAAFDPARLIDPAGRRPSLEAARLATRPVWFDGWHDTPVYRREYLPPAAELTGPAVVVQMDCTTLLHPGDHARQDRDGNLIVTVGGADGA